MIYTARFMRTALDVADRIVVIRTHDAIVNVCVVLDRRTIDMLI